jgi:hypothetical protein
MKIITVLFITLFMLSGILNAQQRNAEEYKNEQKVNLLRFAEETQQRMEAEKAEAIRVAKEKGWLI